MNAIKNKNLYKYILVLSTLTSAHAYAESSFTQQNYTTAPTPDTHIQLPKHEYKGIFSNKTPWQLSGRVGTLGVGPELGYHPVKSHWGVRIDFDTYSYRTNDFMTGKNHFNYEYSKNIDATGNINTKYSGRAKLMNGSLFGDFYPWKKSGFRLTTGVIFSKNNFKFQARGQVSNASMYLKNYQMSVPFSIDDPGHLDGKGKWGFPAPYVGIGWNTLLGAGFYFTGDFGFMFQGTGHLKTASSGLMTQISPKIYEEALGSNVHEIKHYMNVASPVYPVLMVGFGYRF